MAEWHEPATRAVADLLREAAALGGMPEGQEGTVQGVVSAWVLVVEVATPEGKWLHRLEGPEGIVSWIRAGLLHDALYGSWPEVD